MAGRSTRGALIAGALLAGGVLLWLASMPLAARLRRTHPAAPSPEATRAAHEEAPAAARARATRNAASSRPNATTRPETSDEVRARLARQALEQRKRNHARHAELSARWASETRDEPWSTDQEHALRAAASTTILDHLLLELECRRTLCRLEISAADSNTAFALQKARAFNAQLGTDTGSAMVGSGPDLVMEVFAAREGMGSPKGP